MIIIKLYFNIRICIHIITTAEPLLFEVPVKHECTSCDVNGSLLIHLEPEQTINEYFIKLIHAGTFSLAFQYFLPTL